MGGSVECVDCLSQACACVGLVLLVRCLVFAGVFFSSSILLCIWVSLMATLCFPVSEIDSDSDLLVSPDRAYCPLG